MLREIRNEVTVVPMLAPMLKKIGTRARTEIEQILGRHIYLDLFVRVQPDWRMSAARIAEYGYGGSDEKDE